MTFSIKILKFHGDSGFVIIYRIFLNLTWDFGKNSMLTSTTWHGAIKKFPARNRKLQDKSEWRPDMKALRDHSLREGDCCKVSTLGRTGRLNKWEAAGSPPHCRHWNNNTTQQHTRRQDSTSLSLVVLSVDSPHQNFTGQHPK